MCLLITKEKISFPFSLSPHDVQASENSPKNLLKSPKISDQEPFSTVFLYFR